jgi:hypothetical protein
MAQENDINEQYENIREKIAEQNASKLFYDRLIYQYFKFPKKITKKDLDDDLDTDWGN